VEFKETRLGWLLMHETPIEYSLIMAVAEETKKDPSVYMIENLAYRSDEAFFHTRQFWLALRKYRLEGLRPKTKFIPTAANELYYIDRKLKTFSYN